MPRAVSGTVRALCSRRGAGSVQVQRGGGWRKQELKQFHVVTQPVRKVPSPGDGAGPPPPVCRLGRSSQGTALRGGVGMRSALVVCSPGSHLKGNLRRPDERGPFFLGALQEKHRSGSYRRPLREPGGTSSRRSSWLLLLGAVSCHRHHRSAGGSVAAWQGPGLAVGPTERKHTQGVLWRQV